MKFIVYVPTYCVHSANIIYNFFFIKRVEFRSTTPYSKLNDTRIFLFIALFYINDDIIITYFIILLMNFEIQILLKFVYDIIIPRGNPYCNEFRNNFSNAFSFLLLRPVQTLYCSYL